VLKLNWSLRQHTMAFGLWVFLLALTQAAPEYAMGMGAWLDGFYRIFVEGFPLKIVFDRLGENWVYFLWLAWTYWFLNGTYFMGVKDRVTYVYQGEDKPPQVLLPFLHPYGPDRRLIARLLHFRFGYDLSAWPRFYFVTLGFFSVAYGFSLILAIYAKAPGSFPQDLFSAWRYAFDHWWMVWNAAVSGGSFLTGIVLAYLYWRYGAPLLAELFVNTDTFIGRFLRKHCLQAYEREVESLIEDNKTLGNLARFLAFDPRAWKVPFNRWHT
jgi:hypothetical protein